MSLTSASFLSPTPLGNTSSGVTTNPGAPAANPTAGLQIDQKGVGDVNKTLQLQAAQAPIFVLAPGLKIDQTGTAKVPSVITAKPAIKQAQGQIADVNAKTLEVATQMAKAAASTASLTTPGAGYVSADQATRDKVAAMSAAAGAKPITTPMALKPTTTEKATEPDVTDTTPKGTTPTGVKSIAEQFSQSLQDNDDKAQAALDDYTAKQNQIMNGSYPLSDAQRSQLDSITQQYQGLIQQQKSINQSYQGALTMAGISAGRNMYAPEIELGNINAAVSAGAQKIAGLNSDMLSSLSAARDAIQSNNMEALSQTYKNINQNLTNRRQSVKDTYDAATKAATQAKEDYQIMQNDIKAMADVGQDPSKFAPGFFDKIDAQREKLGLPSYAGYSENLYKLQYDTTKKKKDVEDTDAQVKRANSFISIFDKLGTKGDITVGDHTYNYQGSSPDDYASGTETDNKTGKLMAWKVNTKTGDKQLYDLGINMKTGNKTVIDVGGLKYAYDENTGNATPIWVSDSQQTWDQGEFASGNTGPALPGSANAGQCGAMNNYFYGRGVVGNSLQSKLDPLSQYKVDFGVNNVTNIQAGMSFVQNIGTYGHIGFIESVGVDPVNKKGYVTVFESNYHGDGKISHGRQMYLDDPTLKMISNYPASRLPATGPDAPTRQQLGDTGTGDQGFTAGTMDKDAADILSQTGLGMMAYNYMTQGSSALTRMSEKTRKNIMSEAETWAKTNGVDISTFQSQYKAYNEVVQSNIKRQNQTKIMERELVGTLTNLDEAANNAGLGNITAANVAKMMAGGQFNDPNMQQYKTHLNQLVTEMAGYNAATQGKASPDLVDLEDAKNVIQQGFAAGGVEGFRNAIESSTEKMKSIMQVSVEDARQQVWDLFGVGENYKTTAQRQEKENIPEIPTYFSGVVKSERGKGTSDDKIIDYFLESSPQYASLVNEAQSRGKSSADILNALMQ